MLTRLLILWLLAEGPMHGYRIKKVLEDESLRFWFPVAFASIYSMLRTLVRQGHARIAAREREGRRPQRTLYRLTPSGRKHYAELLRAAWRTPPSPANPVNLALAAFGDLDDAEVRTLQRQRTDALEHRLERLDGLARSAPAGEIVERERAIAVAELKWLRKCISRVESKRRKR
ncbi:MAG: PadR family transcriptional regulator [Planctomycetes bacterium]|nr:PadR family transcriptional regulator [Planctomycetota bacterium]